MGLSRKRKKQLTKLKKAASSLWEEQQAVLVHAGVVGREAGRQSTAVYGEAVVPRVKYAVDEQIVPAVSGSYTAAKDAVTGTTHKVVHEVLPSVSSSVASALATLEASKDPRVQKVLAEVTKAGGTVGKKATKAYAQVSKNSVKLYDTVGKKYGFIAPAPKKASLGVGGWIGILLGVAAVVGISYAVWQTLRADDELWVLDEKDDTDAPQ